ncbi:MAG: CehA/McbA family metallohydrolase [Chloroflexi bacterium]|nr:CehA/McbA family metallohydrolase [Chloroflexota bacterium]
MSSTLSPTHSFRATAGWYAGDFHAHTTASDGENSPDALMQMAVAAGLDFVSITDHNTVAGLDAFQEPLPLPAIRGIEITLFSGHFNVFGLDGAPAWLQLFRAGSEPEPERRKRLSEQVVVADLMQQCQAEGFLVSINHPLLAPWGWQESDVYLSRIDCLEIWNDPTWPDNASANPATVDMWTQWLNAGYRITAIGGSDFHFTVSGADAHHPAIHLPRTLVYAEQLSAAAILRGVRRHHVYVSMEPSLTFHVQGHEGRFAIGTDMGEMTGNIELQATVSTHLPDVVIQIIKNGVPIGTKRCQGEQGSLACLDHVDGTPVWCCDVRDAEGRIIAVTNPIFAGDWLPPAAHTFGDFLPQE